ncbi:hypothetical protein BDD12DRAFT_489801 [Trichophaea hybrida]|nr:hypothetical protein BDD12DRAFT_489801 [Trichophaea hybrida]
MEHRLPLPREMEEDEFRRLSFTSSVAQRNSVVFSHVPSVREPENTFETPPGARYHEPIDVFATPTNSRPNSSHGSLADACEFGADATSTHRGSLTLSVPRSLSLISVADGGWGQYRRSISLPRSATPSISVASSSGSIGLRRSNTANTHTTSTSSIIYSIPSQISGLSSPPSPIQSIAPVRPRFDYSGHQQTLSVGGSELDDADPFGDGFEIPVGDGFAPHNQRTPTSSAASDSGSFGSLPPPYTQYPGFISPKPENSEIDLGLAVVEPVAGSGIPLAEDDGVRRRRESRRVTPVGGVGIAEERNDMDENASGAAKEWHQKKVLGSRIWLFVLAAIAALLVGIAVGLGVGLGIARRSESDRDHSPTSTLNKATKYHPPSPEQTVAPKSDPNNLYPNIPVGQNLVSPIELKTFSSGCKIVRTDKTSPAYFKSGSTGLWTCNIPASTLLWDIDVYPADLVGSELSKLKSVPDTLTCAHWESSTWGGYIISSEEGEYNKEKKNTVYQTPTGERVLYSAMHGFREGMQGPAFFRQPLGFRNVTWEYSEGIEKRANHNGPLTTLSYTFGILYDKTVILKETTMIQTFNTNGDNDLRNGNGMEFTQNEKVWMCVWEKTLLEVELMVNESSISQLRKATAAAHGGGSGDPYETDLDDEDNSNFLTTIIVGLPTSHPKSKHHSSTASSTIDYSAKPTFPSNSKLSGDARLIKRGQTKGRFRHLSRKVYMKESRPTEDRLRGVLGIDRTDDDLEGRARPGAVRCRKMLVQDDGGLVEYTAVGEEVEVRLEEILTEAESLEKRDDETDDDDSSFPADTGCSCTWES